MRRAIAPVCVALLGLTLTTASGQDSSPGDFAANQELIAETRSNLQGWVEMRKAIAEKRTEWNGEQEILQGQIDLLQQEIAQYQEDIESAEDALTQAEQRRGELQNVEAEVESSIDVVEVAMPDLEGAVRELMPYFPTALNETQTMRQLASQLPQSADTRRPVGDRMVVVLGILNEIHKFNSAVTVRASTRDFGGGEPLALNILHLGMAQGYYVTEDGSQAGRYMPAADEWNWISEPSLAEDIASAIRFYRSEATTAPEYIGLPVEVTDPFGE